MCMKRSFLLILSVLLVCLSGASKRVSEQEAYEMALKFIQGKSIKANQRMVKGAKGSPALKNIYVFNVENNGGFVIVSGDDRTRSILGYSDNGELNPERIPCNMQWLLDNYEKQIASLTDDTSILENTRSEDRQDIPALIDVQWGQDEPYNSNCPTLNGERCLTGCVATAMAQLIQSHKWPQESVKAIPAYTTPGGIYLEELPTVSFDWDGMNEVSVSQLMRYCGQSVGMDYNPWGSGANIYDVPNALKSYFDYTLRTTLEARSDYSDSEWEELIYKELIESHPVLYSGESSEAGGHSFIVDGYKEGLFHLNWGWEGLGDGFFSLDTLNPTMEHGFTKGQTAIINAYPADHDEEKILPKVKVTKMDCNERLVFRNSLMDDFPVCSFEVYHENLTGRELHMEMGLTLFKDSDIYCKLATIDVSQYPYAGGMIEVGMSLSSDIPEGKYKIIPVYRFDSSDSWIPLADSDKIYLEITVSEKELSIQPYPIPSFEDDIVDYGMYMINNVRYRLRAEYGKYLAYPQPLDGNETYEGELYIPDYVTHDGIDYKVSNKSGFSNGMLDNNALLTSLSTPVAFNIYNAAGLKTLEFREGVNVLPPITECPELETIKLDAASEIGSVIHFCDNLKSITINNDQEIKLYASDEGVVWSKEELPALCDIYFTSDVPPVFMWCIDTNIKVDGKPCDDITIHVPIGTKEVFETHEWNGWNIEEDQPSVPVKVIWDYCGNDVYAGYGIGYIDRANDLEFAMRVPAQYMTPYRNCKVTAIEYDTTGAYDIEYVFLTMPGLDYYTKQPAKKTGSGKMRVNLEKPYIISDEDLFVGIGRHGYIEISWANDDVEENGLWLRTMGVGESNEWSMVMVDSKCHPVPIHMIIEGDNLPDDVMVVDAKLSGSSANVESPNFIPSANNHVCQKQSVDNGSGFIHFVEDRGKYPMDIQPLRISNVASVDKTEDIDRILLKVRNRSPRFVRNVTLDWKLDGMDMEPLKFETVFRQNYNEIVYVDLPDELRGRNHTIEFNVAEIEGKPDTVTYNNSKSSTFSTQSTLKYPRKFVMEEATGTWCGFCPMGLATIEKMKERYPENFIAIEVHSDTEMSVADGSYNPFLDLVSSFPSAMLNRTGWVDFLSFDLDSELESGEAIIKASASFSEGNSVEVNTETEFGFDDSGEDKYRIAYVVVEDNVGPYFQNNNYSNPDAPDDPEGLLNWWTHQPQMALYEYDDVVRSITNYNGLIGLFPENIEAGEVYNATKKIALPENFDNHEKLRIVTLLIDVTNGEILNADQTGIDGDYCSVQENVASDHIKIRSVKNGIVIENACGRQVVVSAIDGATVKKFKAASDSETLTLRDGIFLVNAGGHTAKVIIR